MFQTRKSGGMLTAKKKGAWIEMDFPATTATPVSALCAKTWRRRWEQKSQAVWGELRFDYLAEVESEDAVRALSPDFAQDRPLAGSAA